jgi:molybdopterin-containing oxidoreductase family iron-sulfur binding subunit
MRMGFVFDTTRCVGCNACSMSCKQANNLPASVWYSRVLTDGGDAADTPAGVFPRLSQRYITLNCQHCANPTCTRVCPVGATSKDEDTGIVKQDTERCIGCRMCVAACPYTGVRTFNWQEPKYELGFALGEATAPKHFKQTVEKCTFCAGRIAEGEQPACTVLCPARARHYGDLDDPESEVSQRVLTRTTMRLLEEKGTDPSVYFIV